MSSPKKIFVSVTAIEFVPSICQKKKFLISNLEEEFDLKIEALMMWK
jgi:hypothetical protein